MSITSQSRVGTARANAQTAQEFSRKLAARRAENRVGGRVETGRDARAGTVQCAAPMIAAGGR